MTASPSPKTPLQLMEEQTLLLRDIRDELYRKKRIEERTRLIRRIILITKYVLLIGGVLYFAYSVHMALEGIRSALPTIPEISLPQWNT